MRVPSSLLVAVFFLGSALPVALAAQQSATSASPATAQPTPPVRDPQALAVLTQSLNATGGLSGIAAIQDYTANGTITYYWAGEEVQGTATVRGMGLTCFRLDASLPQGVRTWAVDGYSETLIDTNGTSQVNESYTVATAGSMTLPYVRMLAALTDSSASVADLGTVSVGTSQVRRVHVAPQAAAPGSTPNSGGFDLDIDPASGLVVRFGEVVYSDFDFRTPYTHELFFTNYQPTGGVFSPFAITEKVDGQTTWSMTLQSVAFNSGLTETEFTPSASSTVSPSPGL
jgi:hypothetical protein